MRNMWVSIKWFVSELPRLWRLSRASAMLGGEMFFFMGALPVDAEPDDEAVYEFYRTIAEAAFDLGSSTRETLQ